jgi:hypothetical protein
VNCACVLFHPIVRDLGVFRGCLVRMLNWHTS